MESKTTYRVLVVDNHATFAQGLVLLLTKAGIATDSGWAIDRDDALLLSREISPQVIILDLGLRSVEPFRLAAELIIHNPRVRLIVLDDYVRWISVRAAVAAGAAGYWPKTARFDDLAPAIEWIASGGYAFCPEVEPYLQSTGDGLAVHIPQGTTPLAALTARELQIMRMLAGLDTTRDAATKLRLSRSTVENHKSRIMKKLGLHRMTQVVRLAIHEGIISP
jgi:DNA-binding NarL/FixJ family response regulator